MLLNIRPLFHLYKNVPLGTKLFLFIRFLTAPFFDLEKHIPKSGSILDLGCGHGLFSVILYIKSSSRKILGIDPDKSKILETKNLEVDTSRLLFSTASLQSLAKQKKRFDSIVISDVVYLLSDKDLHVLLADCKKILTKEGRLYIKTSQKNNSLGHKLAVAQEKIMVQLLKKTHSNEETLYFRTVKEYQRLFAKNGLEIVKEVPLHTFFFHPHYLFILRPK